jgi:hypothetical protein
MRAPSYSSSSAGGAPTAPQLSPAPASRLNARALPVLALFPPGAIPAEAAALLLAGFAIVALGLGWLARDKRRRERAIPAPRPTRANSRPVRDLGDWCGFNCNPEQQQPTKKDR